MRKLTLIVHANVEQALANVLRGMDRVTGFTFTRVEGHGAQDSRDPSLSARDLVVGYTPHVRVDIVLEDQDVDSVLAALERSHCGMTGRCIYWVTKVERHGRL